jgi:hypothetical protein
MNTTNARVPIETLSPRSPALSSPSGHRSKLVVVISGIEQEAHLASRIWPLVQRRDLEVLLLGVCRTVTEEPELSRRLATLAAFLRNQEVAVEFRVDYRRDWLDHLKADLDQDDEVACYQEDQGRSDRPPLSDVLSRSLRIPIREFPPLESSAAAQPAHLRHAFAWLASVMTIAAFLVLQVRIVTVLPAGTQTAILLLALFPEVGLILLWNSLLS